MTRAQQMMPMAKHVRATAYALLVLLACGPGSAAHAQDAVRFRPVDVYIDSGARPLAAYQVEIVADHAMIAGVEGGEHAAFREPPYYDAEALKGGRIVVAAFNTGTDLPHGRTRVATLHVREDGPAAYQARLIAAGNPTGQRIAAEAFANPRE
jgi:hypothetical protein